MRPIEFDNQDGNLAPPKEWDKVAMGDCVGLPVVRNEGGCISLWKPDADELEWLNNGGVVRLHVLSGDTQPPVSLLVQNTGDEAVLDVHANSQQSDPQGAANDS